MRLSLKIRGGALQFVLFIGAVIAVLLLTYVLLTYSHMLFSKKTDRLLDTIERADIVLQHTLNGTTVPFNHNLWANDGIKVDLTQDFWGAFEIIKVTTSFQKKTFTKTALVGQSLLEKDMALYLKDNLRPMIIVGNAKIIGDAYLPQQGIRAGNISGQSFFGERLVYGRQRNSKNTLPKIDSELMQNFTKLASSSFIDEEQSDQINFGKVDLINSFEKPTLYIQNSTMDLSGKRIVGNIILKAGKRIVVDASTHLVDAIIVAPEIVIKNGVKGKFQAFATKKILVGQNCLLEYPSVLAVIGNKTQENTNNPSSPNIEICKNSIVNGMVCYLNDAKENRYNPQIKIHKTAQINGQVYCEQRIELKGAVFGNVVANGFIAMENGNIYQNHLFEGHINAHDLPSQYTGLGYDGNFAKAVAKWLY